MPGPLLHLGATVLCSHGGQATPTAPNPRVLLSGNGPCVTGQWLLGATRALIAGQPALLQASPSICAPTGTPMMAVVAQTRVIGT